MRVRVCDRQVCHAANDAIEIHLQNIDFMPKIIIIMEWKTNQLVVTNLLISLSFTAAKVADAVVVVEFGINETEKWKM